MKNHEVVTRRDGLEVRQCRVDRNAEHLLATRKKHLLGTGDKLLIEAEGSATWVGQYLS